MMISNSDSLASLELLSKKKSIGDASNGRDFETSALLVEQKSDSSLEEDSSRVCIRGLHVETPRYTADRGFDLLVEVWTWLSEIQPVMSKKRSRNSKAETLIQRSNLDGNQNWIPNRISMPRLCSIAKHASTSGIDFPIRRFVRNDPRVYRTKTSGESRSAKTSNTRFRQSSRSVDSLDVRSSGSRRIGVRTVEQ